MVQSSLDSSCQNVKEGLAATSAQVLLCMGIKGNVSSCEGKEWTHSKKEIGMAGWSHFRVLLAWSLNEALNAAQSPALVLYHSHTHWSIGSGWISSAGICCDR